ncbi:MAG: Gfo/Idh/MocA family oxidoreductase [Verrucomicrobiales bacterium]
MGRAHRQNLIAGKVDRLELTAICDLPQSLPEKREGEAQFTDVGEMARSGEVDAVLIATPHYFHTTMGIEALEAGVHVLVEKPLSVHKADCERLIAAHKKEGQVFAAMFNQRTDPHYTTLKNLIDGGELGEVRRINWEVTHWFRTEFYYASGGWRATWKGEGGGVLLNQCPHNLDLFQWLFGMPKFVHGFCNFGRYHQIEVEDDVTVYFGYEGGKSGLLIASTGEAPGQNRLEVTCERGLVRVEDGAIRWTRNARETSEFSDQVNAGFAKPDTWDVTIPIEGTGGQHLAIMQNFTNAILDGEPLLSPAAEGINSVELPTPRSSAPGKARRSTCRWIPPTTKSSSPKRRRPRHSRSARSMPL